ncbi:MAG: hypothetical protein OZ948_07145 [Deltaproteobacteria bacterium]|nr:hypothetical protein [Deltaproteobacteria bacterium]
MEAADRWRRCSSCKAPLAFAAPYWACNVSTCNRGRTALTFCSVSCWDAHLAVVPHRESWALERRAPTRAEWAAKLAEDGGEERPAERAPATAAPARAPSAPPAAAAAPRRILPPPAPARPDPLAREVLIVASKLKAYVRARAGMNTSDRCVEPLSDAVRELAERAIEKARAEGRRTVLERDFE